MQILPRPLQIVTRAAALAVVAGASTFAVHAQQTAPAAASQPIFYVEPQTTQSLIAANDAPAAIGYSSSAGADETAAAESYMSTSLAADPSPQPPPRRYGRRPVYADSSHNADGSAKYTFFGGAGFTVPTGGTHAYFSPNYDFQVGGGRNFNKQLAALIEFDWHDFGIQSSTLNNLLGIYNGLGASIAEVGGHAHVWSFTVGPQYTFFQADKFGAYAIGGVGFYHKVTDFTTPETGEYCDPYYGCYEYQADATVDSYVSNAFGVNGGIGFTYKTSRFNDVKFYGEARYVYTANSSRPYYDGTTGTNPSSNANYFDVFPQNSAKTTYIPVTFGIRF
jgi:hypothetical protein